MCFVLELVHTTVAVEAADHAAERHDRTGLSTRDGHHDSVIAVGLSTMLVCPSMGRVVTVISRPRTEGTTSSSTSTDSRPRKSLIPTPVEQKAARPEYCGEP